MARMFVSQVGRRAQLCDSGGAVSNFYQYLRGAFWTDLVRCCGRGDSETAGERGSRLAVGQEDFRQASSPPDTELRPQRPCWDLNSRQVPESDTR